MNRFLLSALAAAFLSGGASAYEKATPGMMKSALEPVSSRVLPTGEYEVTLALPLRSSLSGVERHGLNLTSPMLVPGMSEVATWSTRAASTASEPFMQFNYAGDPYMVYGMDEIESGEKVYLTVYFPETYAKMYNNCRLKDLTFVTGTYGGSDVNRLTTANVFVAKTQGDIPDKMLYNRSSKVSNKAFQAVTLDFVEDIIIKEGEPLYIGYAVSPTSPDDLFMVVDGNLSEDAAGALVGIDNGSTEITWQNAAPEFGNLCSYVTIVGDDLPKNGAMVYDMGVPMQVNPGEKFTASVDLINMNSNDITSFEYSYKIGDSEPYTATHELAEPLNYGDVVPFTLGGLSTEELGLSIPFEFKVTKVNGVDNYYPNAARMITFKCFDVEKGYDPHALIEEGTSTRCGYCPIGISMMEYAAENYPEYYHRAALHYNMGNGASQADDMYVAANAAMGNYFPTLPGAYINRWADMYPGYYKQLLPLFKEQYGSALAPAGVVGLNVLPADNKATKITASVSFALDLENSDRYRIGFYITEDDLGPYSQLNYYSGMDGDYDGWEKMKQEVKKQYYNDVVRNLIGGAQGCENSLPAVIKAGETYTYTVDADLSAVSGDKYNVIAFIIDNEEGEILNSRMLPTDMAAAVDEVLGESNVKVSGAAGCLVISGGYSSAAVYSIDGKKVAVGSGEETISLPQGLYIVAVDGKSFKVAVN